MELVLTFVELALTFDTCSSDGVGGATSHSTLDTISKHSKHLCQKGGKGFKSAWAQPVQRYCNTFGLCALLRHTWALRVPALGVCAVMRHL